MNKDEIKSCGELNRKASPVTLSSQIKTLQEWKKVASTALTTTFTTTVVNTNVQPQFQSVKSSPFITLQKYILQKTNKQRKRKQAEKQEYFTRYRWFS